jgi:hypothetical protein
LRWRPFNYNIHFLNMSLRWRPLLPTHSRNRFWNIRWVITRESLFLKYVSTAKATDQRSIATEMLGVTLQVRSRTLSPRQRFRPQLYCKIVRFLCRTLRDLEFSQQWQINTVILWVAVSAVGGYQWFGATYCLHLQGRWWWRWYHLRNLVTYRIERRRKPNCCSPEMELVSFVCSFVCSLFNESSPVTQAWRREK